jgi:hypothetical protein
MKWIKILKVRDDELEREAGWMLDWKSENAKMA